MPRPLKLTLAVLAGLLALAIAAVAIVSAVFDPNDLKPVLIERVRQHTQRTLAIPGPIRLSFLPSVGVETGNVSLSERGSDETFASLQSARVSIAFWPLLKRQVVVDRVTLAGMKAQVTRFADGRTSIDDLVGPTAAEAETPGATAASPPPAAPTSPPASGTPTGPGGSPLRFEVAGLAITDASLAFDDRQAGRRLTVSQASLETGRLAPGTASELRLAAHLGADEPALDARLTGQARLLLDPDAKRVALTGMDVKLTGRAAGIDGLVLALSGNIDAKAGPLHLTLDRLALTAEGRQGASPLRARLALAAPGELKHDTLALPRLDLEASLPAAGPTPIALRASGSTTVALEPFAVDTRLAGQIDQSRFTASAGVSKLAPLTARFDVDIDQFDADRFRGAGAAGAAASNAGGASGAGAPIDLSALAGLDLTGRLRIGALKVANLRLTALEVGARSRGGSLRLEPLNAKLYEGSMAGGATVVASKTPRFALQQSLEGIRIGPLLKDLTGKDQVLGRGAVTLDVDTQGATPEALTRALAGTARVELRDGAVKGINIAQAVRTAKSALSLATGSKDTAKEGTGSNEQSTDFSEMSASFRIAGGVAHSDDLDAKSPLLRIGGVGDVDLGLGRIDYLVKATVVTTLKGQGGPELDALRGQTIPVRLKGPFDRIAYRIDVEGLAKDAAKRKLEEAVQRKLGVQDNAAARDAAKKKLGNELKGLLGR